MSNPLTTQSFAIPFDRIRAAHVEPAIDQLIAEAQARIDEIAASEGAWTYANTLGALETATETLEWAANVVSHLESVATTPEWRAAHDAIQPKLSRFFTQIPLNPGLWRALRAFAETDEAQSLTGPHSRHLKKTLDEFRRHGAELDDAGKARLEEINVELAELTTRFAQNVLDATNQFELLIEDENRLAGLPATLKDAARESAKQANQSGWRFTLQAPSYVPALMYLDDAEIRETLWRANTARGTHPDTDNRGLVDRILVLRQAKAQLLGFRDFADLVLIDRMAKSGAEAQRFVDDLRQRTITHFERENRELEEFCTSVAKHSIQPLRPWDLPYFAEKLRRASFDFDEEELRPFFAVDQVLDGLFETIKRLYGVAVTPDGLPVWDPAVRTYRLLDEDGRHLASFYVDLYPRTNKRDGAWMNGLITGRPPAPHLGLFCANAHPPVGDQPALFTHRDVETLFHEFGHLIHHCLSTVPIRSLAGINVVWDFVELPSQIMENWCWEREGLDLFARHYQTRKGIPDELFEKMQRARTYRAANAQMRQLGFAQVDLTLHREYDPAHDELLPYTRAILQEFTPVELPDDYAFIASFSHLFANSVGYAAGYYSYKWAEVLDADAFTRFQDHGIFNREIGRAFRREILERGDSAEPDELYRAFAGRDARLEPLLARQGLLSDAEEAA